jgi:hypothetical protein
MHLSLAAGDAESLEGICQSGLADKLGEQIRARGSSRLRWLSSDATKAKLVSIRQAALPKQADSALIAIQEAVVYFDNEQTLREVDGRGEVLSERKSRVQEYVVLQRKIMDGESQDWYLQGMVEPTTFEKWAEKEAEEDYGANPTIKQTSSYL